MYIRDVVAVFKLFCWGSPLSEKSLHHHDVAAQALRSRTYVSAFALVVYWHDPNGTSIVAARIDKYYTSSKQLRDILNL